MFLTNMAWLLTQYVFFKGLPWLLVLGRPDRKTIEMRACARQRKHWPVSRKAY
jgi:hypothetical protein